MAILGLLCISILLMESSYVLTTYRRGRTKDGVED